MRREVKLSLQHHRKEREWKMTPSSRFLFPDVLFPVTPVFSPSRCHAERNKRLEIQHPGLDQAGPGLTVLWRGTAPHSIWPLCQVGLSLSPAGTKRDRSKHLALAPRTPSGRLGLGQAWTGRFLSGTWSSSCLCTFVSPPEALHPS